MLNEIIYILHLLLVIVYDFFFIKLNLKNDMR